MFELSVPDLYIHEKRLPLVVKETNRTCCTTGTTLPTEQTDTHTQTGRYTHTRPRITHSTLSESSGAALLTTVDYNSIHCAPIAWLIAVHLNSPITAANNASHTPSSPPYHSPPSVDHHLHIPRGSHYRRIFKCELAVASDGFFHASFGSSWRRTACYP